MSENASNSSRASRLFPAVVAAGLTLVVSDPARAAWPAAVRAAMNAALVPRLEGSLPGPPPLFLATNWWNVEVAAAPVDAGSSGFIGHINQGGVKHLHPDLGGTLDDGVSIYGMPFIVVDGNQAKQAVNFQYFGESDGVHHPGNNPYPFYPIPDAAITQAHWIEGGDPGNVDDRDSEDRHMLIVDRDNRYLYELYNVWYDADAQQWQAGSGAFFDMKTNDRRPDTWTSADAAGLAILPGLLRYDEVFGPSEIRHALRFTVRDTNGYVYPASHDAGSSAGALPMGARLRLKASKDISGFAPEVQKIFRAMKAYGLINADNGTDMYIGGTWDDRWNNDVLNPAFDALTASDFEVVELGYAPPLAPALAVDARSSAGSNQNGILEPGETVIVEPSWEGTGGTAPLSGVASGFSGPAGATYTIVDGASAYGTPGPGQTADCFDATGNCFTLAISNPATRPAAHWDAAFTETINGSASKTWTLHVGASFTDVPESHQFYTAVEVLFHNGITAGCGGGGSRFCPDASITRAEMAVFLLKGKLGAAYVPPPGTGTVFSDVAPGSFAVDWIEDLAASGITVGCSPGKYCPSNFITRAEMAIFLLRALHGSAYAPPPATGIFDDVPAANAFARWIEELSREGITVGCGGNDYCPDDPSTRAQMGAFLKTTFGLALYEP